MRLNRFQADEDNAGQQVFAEKCSLACHAVELITLINSHEGTKRQKQKKHEKWKAKSGQTDQSIRGGLLGVSPPFS